MTGWTTDDGQDMSPDETPDAEPSGRLSGARMLALAVLLFSGAYLTYAEMIARFSP
ncbi:MAG: hypothetical protein AAGA28_19555 [Pseudomonadota bacterium]